MDLASTPLFGSKPLPSTVTKVAIVGTGVIGSGWAALFCAKGYTVVAFVRSPASETKFLSALEAAWKLYMQRGLAIDPEGYKKVTCVMNLAQCVADADYVQESVVEDLTLKQVIIEEIDQYAPANVIIGSSTSFIPLSCLRMRARKHPERVATAHPTLPQWDAFCEVLGSSRTHTHWLAALYGKGTESITGLGMDVVPMKKEAWGHVHNSIMVATMGQIQSLVNAGVCNAAEADLALIHFARIVTAGGGMSGGLVGLTGGGSVDATTDLMTDVGTGYPLAMGAVFISRYFPAFLARPALLGLQGLCWPMRFLKSAMRWYQIKSLQPWFDRWNELWSGAQSRDFEALAVSRVCALEKQRAQEDSQTNSRR